MTDDKNNNPAAAPDNDDLISAGSKQSPRPKPEQQNPAEDLPPGEHPDAPDPKSWETD